MCIVCVKARLDTLLVIRCSKESKSVGAISVNRESSRITLKITLIKSQDNNVTVVFNVIILQISLVLRQ